jgi:hypothetical protein
MTPVGSMLGFWMDVVASPDDAYCVLLGDDLPAHWQLFGVAHLDEVLHWSLVIHHSRHNELVRFQQQGQFRVFRKLVLEDEPTDFLLQPGIVFLEAMRKNA